MERIRKAVGDDFLISVNTNRRKNMRAAAYVNGLFMETLRDNDNGYTRERLDFIAKTVHNLFHRDGYDAVVAEKLKPSNMVKNRHLAKSISDASWGNLFFDWCHSAAKRDGKHFHQGSAHNTSQTCSECCQRLSVNLKLSKRLFHCKSCGLKLDRDHNAAINILYTAETCALRGEVWNTILYEREKHC